jgi:hypothetical protein
MGRDLAVNEKQRLRHVLAGLPAHAQESGLEELACIRERV